MMYFHVSELKKKSDAELLHLFYKGYQNAITILLARYKKQICYHIYSYVKSKEITEDIYQDIICKVLLHLKNKAYNEQGKFFPWLMKIAKNQIIDYYRIHKNKKHIACITNNDNEETCIFDILETEHLETTNVSANIENSESIQKNKKIIKQLINKLPTEQKEVLILRMYYDMSFKEIADFSKVSINTSLGRMRYALMNLKKMIEKQSLQNELLCG